ncbi:hypothetical protein [Actinokineospora fastidiosa]|uniref:DNRLRE domain-containing protein n=1 Tax=Actinokineospora fastidiosa TaxID=1816 RepID=A0A918LA55_9PSEU|nr:hypothetical protein [Actinokineospora fastidiosa]GGS24530.1 hypothetical protein GCM10010171_17130 [Actinokineospora fastidiosa]
MKLRTVLVAVATGAGLVALAPPAAAATVPSAVDVYPTGWVQTDSRTPHEGMSGGEIARVGAWRDEAGKHHIAKAYFTFDIGRFAEATVYSAQLRLREQAANDCAAPRATEVGLVASGGSPTWADQPVEQVRVAGSEDGRDCVSGALRRDVADLARQALADGRTSLTFAVRISAAHEGDVAYGRTYWTRPWVAVAYNTPPNTPTDLTMGYGRIPCDDTLLFARTALPVRAAVSDPDPAGVSGMDARFAFWAEDDPDSRREETAYVSSGFASVMFPEDMLRDGTTFAWAVRAEDGLATSAWSAPCRFHTDWVRPDAPTVTSSVYTPDGTAGGEGIPGEFTFSVAGSDDVVTFEYGVIGASRARVAADASGSATVTITPQSSGPSYLEVRALDAAGNGSTWARYYFFVPSIAPSVTAEPALIGADFPVRFTARQEGAATFTYRFLGGPETTLPVGADGTAETTLRVTDPAHQFASIEVWTTTADGRRSPVTATYVYISLGEPIITVAPDYVVLGSEHEVLFESALPDVVSYTYWLDETGPFEVAADADGRARITLRATTSGSRTVVAQATTADGTRSGEGWTSYFVDGVAPEVTSAEYPRYGTGSGAGVFRFSSVLAGTAEFRYVLDGVEGVVAAVDGRAELPFTPTRTGYHTLLVRAVAGDGLATDQAYYPFTVE